MELSKKDLQKVEKIYLAGVADKVCAGNLRVYNGTDITPFAREFFSKAFLQVPKTYGLDIDVGVFEVRTRRIRERGIMVSKNIDKVYDVLPSVWLDPEKGRKFLQKIYLVEGEFGDALERKDIKRIYDLAVQHLSFYVDSFYPEDELKRIVGKDDYAVLFTPEYSTYFAIHHGLMDLAEQSYLGAEPDIEGFIRNKGFLSADDITRTDLETEDGVRRKIEQYKKAYTLDQILDEKSERHLRRLDDQRKMDDYIKDLPDDDRANYLYHLAKETATYNEMNRSIVKKAFQVCRNALERSGRDISKATYRDLEKTLERGSPRIGRNKYA